MVSPDGVCVNTTMENHTERLNVAAAADAVVSAGYERSFSQIIAFD